jgi:hypothetical protein
VSKGLLSYPLSGYQYPGYSTTSSSCVPSTSALWFAIASEHYGRFSLLLFVHDLDLLVDHLAAEAVNRYACLAEVRRLPDEGGVHPLVLFTFDDEIVSEALCVWRL